MKLVKLIQLASLAMVPLFFKTASAGNQTVTGTIQDKCQNAEELSLENLEGKMNPVCKLPSVLRSASL